MRRPPLLTISVATALAAVVIAQSSAWAAKAEVIASEAKVRTAPFDVAPLLTVLRGGDALPADDQPQGAWRRVQLPDGRAGFVKETEVRITEVTAPAPPPPSETPAATPATAPAATPATAPAVVPTSLAPAAVPPAAGPPAAVPPAAVPPIVAQQSPTAAAPTPETVLVGVMFEILPVGMLKSTTSNSGGVSADTSVDTVVGVGVAPTLDFATSPYFAVGLSPKAILRLKPDGIDGVRSATEFDIRARFTGRLPMSPNVRVFGRLSPAYSIISLPPSSSTVSVPDPKGFLIDFSVGTEAAIVPNLFLVVELGYQLGFQSSTDATGRSNFDGSRYLHLGAGLAVAF